jgi:hypothetical protein
MIIIGNAVCLPRQKIQFIATIVEKAGNYDKVKFSSMIP